MSMYTSGHWQVGTLEVAASGGVSNIQPLLADNVFKNPSITVVPLGSFASYRYTVSVYIDGTLEETHTYSALGTRHVAHMQFPNKVFPPNIGNETKPGLQWPGGIISGALVPELAGFSMNLTNSEGSIRSYAVYSTFEAWNATATKRLNFS
jgi:hypothetical protein